MVLTAETMERKESHLAIIADHASRTIMKGIEQ
jgi:hypothetical protein